MNISIIFDFLQQLRLNNDRVWFTKHKDEYLQAKEEVEKLIVVVGEQLLSIDSRLQGCTEPSKVLFRIYRDIRFSKDKQPYKTHFGCFFSPGGKSSLFPGYYIHLDPEHSFVSGGIWGPDPVYLKQIRQEIYYNTTYFLNIFNNPEFKKYFKQLDQYEMLKKNPMGFPVDFEYSELLRYKHYTVSSLLTEKILFSDKLVSYIIDAFSALKPFNDFLHLACQEPL